MILPPRIYRRKENGKLKLQTCSLEEFDFVFLVESGEFETGVHMISRAPLRVPEDLYQLRPASPDNVEGLPIHLLLNHVLYCFCRNSEDYDLSRDTAGGLFGLFVLFLCVFSIYGIHIIIFTWTTNSRWMPRYVILIYFLRCVTIDMPITIK